MIKQVSAAGTCYEASKPFSDLVQCQAALTSPAMTIKLVEPTCTYAGRRCPPTRPAINVSALPSVE